MSFLKNRILIILSIFIIILFSLISNVFAVDLTYENEKISLSDTITSYKYYCVFKRFFRPDNEVDFVVICSNDREFCFDTNNNIFNTSYNIETEYYEGDIYYCYIKNFADLSSVSSLSHNNHSLSCMTPVYYDFEFIYSNCNIYGEKKNINGFSCVDYDNVLFPGAPLPVQAVEPMKEIQQVEEIVPKILEIVKMILPVCLILFGVLLVVYLIRSKNLLNL